MIIRDRVGSLRENENERSGVGGIQECLAQIELGTGNEVLSHVHFDELGHSKHQVLRSERLDQQKLVERTESLVPRCWQRFLICTKVKEKRRDS